MTNAEIFTVRNELNHMIASGVELGDLYELSVKLDRLIVQYYLEKRSQRLH